MQSFKTHEDTKTDEPSIVKRNGFTYHFLNGKLHREDGPARYNEENGAEFWYLNGERHRENGPAVTEVDGSTQWWLNGHLHREDGPAIEITKNGRKVWMLNGEFQRAIDKDGNELNQYMQKIDSE